MYVLVCSDLGGETSSHPINQTITGSIIWPQSCLDPLEIVMLRGGTISTEDLLISIGILSVKIVAVDELT
jgi:hypothetical protein